MNPLTRHTPSNARALPSKAHIALLLFGICISACAKETPQSLAEHLASAYKAGDLNAAMAVFDLRDAPAEVQSMAVGTLSDCFGEFTCTVAAVGLNDEFKQDMAKISANPDLEFAVPPLGLIEVKGYAPIKPGAKPEMTLTMPYGSVDGKYKIISEHNTMLL